MKYAMRLSSTRPKYLIPEADRVHFLESKTNMAVKARLYGSGGVLDRVTITKTSKGNLGEPRRVSATSFYLQAYKRQEIKLTFWQSD